MNACGQRYFASKIIAYAGESRVIQEQLHQILTQLSGFALLLFMRRGAPALCAAPLEAVADRMKSASDQIRALRPSSGAGHHFHHLAETRAAVESAIGIAYDCLRPSAAEGDRDDLMRALRTALGHLRATSMLLPGFAMVDLRQACCAAHVGTTRAETVLFSD
jgi:hypothetical protein